MSGLGDTAAMGPVAALAMQVNRFGASAPLTYQFVTVPFPATDVLDPALALTALTIYLRRATDAYASFHDAGTQAAIAQATAGYANPSSFVGTNMGTITPVIKMFADSLGLPSVGADGQPDTDSTTVVAVIAVVLAAWWLSERRS